MRPRSLCLLVAPALAGCALLVRPDPGVAPASLAAEPAADAPRAVGATAIDRDRIAPGVESPYWALVRAGGPLKVGVHPSYPPFGVRAGDRLVGFDVDLARHLGRTLGVTVELRAVPSREVPARLLDGTIDLALTGLTRTAWRAAQVNFSAPYLTVSQAALVERRFAEGTRGTDEELRRNAMASYWDLAREPGLRIAVVRGTRPARLAEASFPGARLTAFDTIEEASRALLSGQVQALVHDAPYVRAWSVLHPDAAGRFRALLQPVTEEPIAIALRKGDLDFLAWLDVYVEEVRGDGTVQELYRRHFVDAAWAEVGEGQR